MDIPILILLAIAAVLLLQYHWKQRHIYYLAYKLPGPPALPVIGNALTFMCKSEEILSVIARLSAKYRKPLRFWFGPLLIVYINHPRHIEKILSSPKLAYKPEVYDHLMKIYLGDGLVSNSGEKYKRHRRLIQPLIHLKFFIGNIKAFQNHTNVLLEKMELRCDQQTFDVHDMIHQCFADIIGDIVLGVKMGAQRGENSDYILASADMYEVSYKRFIRFWLHPNLIYNLTPGKKDQNRITSTTTKFVKNAIEQAWMRIKSRDWEESEDNPIIDQIASIIRKDPQCINNVDFLYHMYTLYVASEDTMTIITAILCVCLGMYQDYQKIATDEIRSVLGETPREVTYDDLRQLKYLDMCIRDVLRLIPIAPMIIRKTIEDFALDDLTIPEDVRVLVSVFEVHRDPEHWSNPEHFHPDHFLPDAVKKRHPFAFVPFSAGPRSCIGKVLAINGLKLVMASILQRFQIEADGKFPDIVLKSGITVRSACGYKIRLKKRVWE